MSSHQEWQEEVIKEHDEKKPFAPENGTPLKFKAGDPVIYTNSNGATFSRTVTGLYKPEQPCSLYARGYRYLIDGSAPWMPVHEHSLKPNTRVTNSPKESPQ